jgi:hypothetical protein
MIKKFIINSTKQNNLIKKDTITIHWITYTIYQVKQKNNTNQIINQFSNNYSIIPINFNEHFFSEEILNTIKKESPQNMNKKIIFFDKKDVPKYNIFIGSWDIPYTFTWNTYTINLWSSLKSIVISLPKLPWWHIVWNDWQDIKVADGIYEKIITGSGKISISYHKTSVMIIGYILSILSFICCIYYYIVKKNKYFY